MVRVPPSPAESLAPAYRVSVTRADGEANGGWVAEVEGFPDASGRGETPEEAIGRSMSVVTDGAADAPADEVKVEPSPRRSGRLLVRMPVTLHDELAKAAGAEGVSLNQLITGILAGAVAWRRGEPAGSLGSAGTSSTTTAAAGLSPRLTRIALFVNLGAVVLAAIAAIVLVVIAWQNGW